MSKKRKLPDLSDCCRFCLARDACSKELFADWIRPKFQDLEKCANLEIVDRPKYPKKICYACLYKLEMWNEFKSKFLETSKSLLARFKTEDLPESIAKNTEDIEEIFENSKKRPRLDVDETVFLNPVVRLRDPFELLTQSTNQTCPSSVSEPKSTPKKIVDSIIEDFATDSTMCIEPTQNQSVVLSDATSPTRKTSKLKNLEHREAQTKRWLERKNARIAATGEILSESDSDYGFQLSPVQKARAKANKEQEQEDEDEEVIEKQQKKFNRLMKNLETNLSEKFQVSSQSVDRDERRMRLRKGNLEEDKKNEQKSPTANKTVSEKVLANLKTKKLQSDNVEELSQQPLTKDVNVLNENRITVIDNKDKGKHKSFKPQHVRSEVTVNNSTYVISTSLDFPETPVSKNVPSRNGINIDITSSDGGKFDIMNAVQLQKVSSKENIDKATENDENEYNVEKCFKIKVEGMEQEDLQRVQVDLINFINQDIGKRLLQDASSSGGKITPKESMAAYKNLNQKLKEIVENFLKQNLKQEQYLREAARYNRKILPEYFKAVEKSSLFQPKVRIARLNRNLFRQYKINNLQILEDVKRQRGLVGPLSRALNKRKAIMPKKYEDFSLSTKPDPSEYARLPSKSTVKPILINNLSTEFSLDSTNDLSVKKDTSQVQNTTYKATPQPTKQPVTQPTKQPVMQPTKQLITQPTEQLITQPNKPQKVRLELDDSIKSNKSQVIILTAPPKSLPLPPLVPLSASSSKPTLVPKTVVPISNVSNSTPVITKVKKPTKFTPKTIQNSIPIIRKVQTTPSQVKQTNINTKTAPPNISITKTLVTTKTVLEKPQSIKPTGTVSQSHSLSNFMAQSARKSLSQRTEISNINEMPIMITVDDDNDASLQTSSSRVVTMSEDDTVVISDSPTPSPLMDSESISVSPTKSKMSNEKMASKVPTTQDRISKSLTTKNTGSSSSIVALTSPPNNSPPSTNLKLSSEKKLTPPTESMKITAAKKTLTKESLHNSKESDTNLNSPSKNKSSPVKPSVKNTPKPAIQRQRHICGICAEELFSKEEAEAHVKNHKIEPTVLTTSTKVKSGMMNSTSKSSSAPRGSKAKPKLMKCKRCQAIVEEANVKTHQCNSIKYNCTLCECSFGADHLLVQHMETHVQPPTKESKTKTNIKENEVSIRDESSKLSEQEEPEEDLENILSDRQAEGYSCFVCDKVFVDEEQMKDHLQMHCEEVTEEISDKIMCAFCGEKFQNEESLEEHVGKHLMENGDEKISMMINLDTRRRKKTLFQCEQCSESFSSSLLLAMHLPLHEEEAAEDAEIEETVEHHVCQICDEIFDTEQELSEHLDEHNGNAHVCILCEKPFASIKDLQDHVSTHL